MDKEVTLAKVFKTFGDDNRIKILEMLKDEELCACKLLEKLNIGQPTLSYHMKILCDCGIVTGRKDGKWVHYSINAEVKNEIKKKKYNTLLESV